MSEKDFPDERQEQLHDDILDSVNTKKKAHQMTREIETVVNARGFVMKSWRRCLCNVHSYSTSRE